MIVNQLACKEAGCPDVEVVMTLLRAKPRPKLIFKVYKAAADMSVEDVESALSKALTEEQAAQNKDAHSHEHGHDEAAAGHHGGDCCEHDHCGGDHDHKGGDAERQAEHDHA